MRDGEIGIDRKSERERERERDLVSVGALPLLLPLLLLLLLSTTILYYQQLQLLLLPLVHRGLYRNSLPSSVTRASLRLSSPVVGWLGS